MATEVVMPRLSDTMDSGTVARWLKHEGDSVSRGDVIAEIETDKANMELESYAGGVLAKILVGEGQSAALGEPIALIAADQAEAQQLSQSGPAAGGGAPAAPPEPDTPPVQAAYGADASTDVSQTPVPEPSEPVYASAQAGRSDPAVETQRPTAPGPDGGNGRIKASPLAKRLAQERGIELVRVTGTGPGGRITKDDVESYATQAAQPRPAAPSEPAPQPVAHPAPQPAQPAPPERAPQPVAPQAAEQAAPAGADLRESRPVEMTRMQQTIARRMTAARFSAPDFVLTAEIDMTEARSLLASIATTEGAPKVGPNDLVIKAVARALREHPEVNAGWENDGIVRYGRVNVGNAVAIEGGLVVPVVVDADTKSLGTIASESKALIEKARTGKLAPSDYEGGTFTVSNLGMYGIDQFTPVINTPEACILGVGSIMPKPVVLDGEVTTRERMRVTLSCDHRVVNGAQGAEFLRTVRGYLERPMLTLL